MENLKWILPVLAISFGYVVWLCVKRKRDDRHKRR